MVTLITLDRSWEVFDKINKLRVSDENKYKELRFAFPQLKLNALDEKENESYGNGILITAIEMDQLINIYKIKPLVISEITTYPCANCGGNK